MKKGRFTENQIKSRSLQINLIESLIIKTLMKTFLIVPIKPLSQTQLSH